MLGRLQGEPTGVTRGDGGYKLVAGLLSCMEKGGAEELRIDRDEALALVGTRGGSVFPGRGHRVVRLAIPHRDVGHARREIRESLVAFQGLPVAS